jgi:hypothetical protein
MKLLTTLAGVVLLAIGHPAGAGEAAVKVVPSPPPEEVPAEIREALTKDGFSFSLDGKVVAEFWMRASVPTRENESGGLGVTFKKLEVGTLLGVVRIAETWSDYRNQPIQPGLFSLRYGVQPADGNHMGVSEYRDYLLLLPIAEEKELERAFTIDDMIPLSFGAAQAAHPAVLALFPVNKEVNQPELLKNDLDQSMIGVKAGTLVLGLVVIGHGEVEGY